MRKFIIVFSATSAVLFTLLISFAQAEPDSTALLRIDLETRFETTNV
ncbi:hypothetical protein L4D76_09755 [Photobacterium sagamiensis]